MAKNMVTKYGMSTELGTIAYGENEEVMKRLLLEMKGKVYPWVRLNRVVRDFEFKTTVVGGNLNPSLRDDLHRELAKQGKCCNCIRCREIGHLKKQIELKLNCNIKNYKEYCEIVKPDAICIDYEVNTT